MQSQSRSRSRSRSRSSHQYLMLQVWCFLLTVSVVVMATLLTAIKIKPEQVQVSSLEPNFSPAGQSVSFIQLVQAVDGLSWEEFPLCQACSLVLQDDSILCGEDGLYFLFVQVSFRKQEVAPRDRSAVLRRNGGPHRQERTLLDGTLSHDGDRTLWLAKIVQLTQGDRISLHLDGDVHRDGTFWGAYRLQ